MEKAYDHFSFKDTLHSVTDAAYSVFCHIIFDWAAHGLGVAVVLLTVGLILGGRKHRLAKPFMAIGKRLAIFSAIVAAPGLFTLATSGSLPPVGVANINSIGYICFWSLICAHALGEESNYQLVVKADQAADDSESEPVSDAETEAEPGVLS